MKLLIIRHGDPDYAIDSLTPTGWEEAGLLAEKLSKERIDEFFVSPLGRAKDTASLTLKKFGKEAVVCDWLQEFPAKIWRPDNQEILKNAWDWLPQDYAQFPELFDRNAWKEVPCLKEGRVGEIYDEVCRQFDLLLAAHGYERKGMIYRAVKPNDQVLAFFCHFGLECVLLSHLMNTSPYPLWQNFCAAPSSVTTVLTEERREGIACFRASSLGDVSHLYAGGRNPSFSARFCEMYTNENDRHD